MKGAEVSTPLRSQWLVRDDRSGSLRTALQRQISAGEDLLGHGKLIYDDQALRVWGERYRDWRCGCAGLLDREFEREALSEFVYATRRASGEPHREKVMSRMLAGLENAIELLVSLRGTLSGQGGAGVTGRATEEHDEREAEAQGSRIA